MTVTNQNFKDNYIANGTNTSFTYTFKIFENTGISVYINDALISSGYTVTNAGNDAGGEIVFSIAPISNSRVTLIRNEPLTQQINPGFGDNDPSQQIEEGLDRGVFRDQALLELINRCLRLSPSSTALIDIPNAEPNKAIGWNGAGDALVNLAVVGGILLGNQDIAGWLKASAYLESKEIKIVKGSPADLFYGLDWYEAGSANSDAFLRMLDVDESLLIATSTQTGATGVTVFSVPFFVLASGDLQVKVNGTIVTNYTIQNLKFRNGEMTVTFATAPANGATILFERINLFNYKFRFSYGVYNQTNQSIKENYLDITQEFSEFRRGIRLPANPNTSTSEIHDCNGVLRAGALIETTGATTYQRGISLVSKIATGTYQITLDETPPNFKIVQCLPRATSSAIFNSASDVVGNQVTIYTRNQAGNLTDSFFYFGIYY